MFAEMIGVIAVSLCMLTAFIYFLKLLQAWLLHRTLRNAIERDSSIAGVLVDKIDRSDWSDAGRQRLGSDDRNGLVLVAIGLAAFGFALVVNDPEWLRYGIGGALFPLLVGLALLARHFWLSRVLEREVAAGA
jgi:hypothetical protein